MSLRRGGSSMRILNFCKSKKQNLEIVFTTTTVCLVYGKLLRVALEDPLEIQLFNLALKARWQTRIHGGAAGQDNMLVKRRANVDISRLNSGENQLCNSRALHVDQVGLEKRLRCFKPLTAHFDDSAVWKL